MGQLPVPGLQERCGPGTLMTLDPVHDEFSAMSQSGIINAYALAVTLVFTAALAIPELTLAQRQERLGVDQAPAELFPSATGNEPTGRARLQIQKRIQDMIDACNGYQAGAESIARELL